MNLVQSKDLDLWNYAETHQAVIVTKDQDFAELVIRKNPGPGVVWLRIGNCKNATLLAWLISLWPEIVSRLAQGDRLVEVRSAIQIIDEKN